MFLLFYFTAISKKKKEREKFITLNTSVLHIFPVWQYNSFSLRKIMVYNSMVGFKWRVGARIRKRTTFPDCSNVQITLSHLRNFKRKDIPVGVLFISSALNLSTQHIVVLCSLLRCTKLTPSDDDMIFPQLLNMKICLRV